jgi:hypothetical protein
MSDLERLALLLFSISIVLRVLCGRMVKRGSKYTADAELHPPLAARWLSQTAIDLGVILSVVCPLAAAGLLLYSLAP